MKFALSTSWNAGRQPSGEAVLDEIAGLGFDAIELGYGLIGPQVEAIAARAASRGVRIQSVHAPCPVPPPAPAGNPELFLLGSTDAVERRLACMLLLRTLDLAVSVGAEAVVAHAARARMPDLTRRVADRLRSGRPPGWWARFTERRLKARRDAEAPRCLDALRRSLAEVLPAFDRAGVALCLENLPSWEGVPNETEMFDLANEFGTPALGYWHDIGHGQVRENLGIAPHRAWAERLLPFTRGIHIHDVRPPDADHLVPPSGGVPFAAFAFYAVDGLLRVFEPGPAATAEELVKGLAHVRKAWSRAPPPAVGGDGPLAAAR